MSAFTESHCVKCGAEFVSNGFTSGYGTRKLTLPITGKTEDVRYCYACCADLDRADMNATGRATMYLSSGSYKTMEGWTVSNWPGTLCYYARNVRKGRHNIAGTRYDVWFRDHTGAEWHGVQYGENTQITHCRRAKVRA